ncbi:class Ib ribonucleoside-diphosphate reductase assembly flavoprotein NrdI [Arthrobacter sp. CP30]
MSILTVDDRSTAADPAAAGAAEGTVTDAALIYFSSVSDNTHRFVEKLGVRAARMPVLTREPTLQATRPYVLVLPTYGGITGKGAVPRQVVKFLNNEQNRSLLRGVIGAGNTNFGETYCLAADIVAAKCNVPVLYRFEVMGTSEDVTRVTTGLEEFWT